MSNSSLLGPAKTKSLINIAALAAGFGLITLRGHSSSIGIEIGLFIISLIVLVRAADVFTDMAVIVGDRMGLSKLNTGILIIAIGTSAPELFSSIGAALNNQPEIIVGNVLGTVVANCLLGVGIAALFATQALAVHREVLATQMSVFFGAVLLTAFSLYDGHFSRLEGAVLLVMLGFYLHHNIRHGNKPSADDRDDDDNNASKAHSMPRLLGLLLINLACLFLSGDFVVTSLSNGADILGLSSAKLATSLLAIGTSIPEIATAIMLVKKNNTDSLFGEIIGSNIFDYLGIFGLISVFKPIFMSGPLLHYLLLSSAAAFFLLFFVMNDRKIRRIEGVILLTFFAAFLIQLTHI